MHQSLADTAGSVCRRPPPILLEESDPLVAAAVMRALRDDCRLWEGLATTRLRGQELPVAVRLVGVHGLVGVAACPLAREARRGDQPAAAAAPAAVLYVLRDCLAAELHRIHGCCRAVAVFVPTSAGGRFEQPPWPRRLEAAGLTPREAEVLALLLLRRTDEEVARQLVVARSTVRAHSRAIWRKLEVRDRRALWAVFERDHDPWRPADESAGRHALVRA